MANQLREIPGVALQRLGDNLLAVRGSPRTAIFAHLDTTGFTLGYRRQLIPIGAPDPQDRDELISADGLRGRLRATAGDHRHAQLRRVRDGEGAKAKPAPGTRWVYARKPKIKGGVITAPYLDNRAGCWAALEALRRCENAAAAFTTGEERHGHGAAGLRRMAVSPTRHRPGDYLGPDLAHRRYALRERPGDLAARRVLPPASLSRPRAETRRGERRGTSARNSIGRLVRRRSHPALLGSYGLGVHWRPREISAHVARTGED